MIFRNIENDNDESVYGVEVSKQGASCSIRWSYPFKCTQICIFEVPFDATFNEADAAAGKYRMHRVKYPGDNVTSTGMCNFAIFAVDDAGTLIRQRKTVYLCPINVTYSMEEDRKVTVVKKGLFRKEEQVTITNYLNVCSDISVAGRKILYKVKDGAHMEDKTFCLPVNLTAGKAQRLKLPNPIELFAVDENITIYKS